MNSYSPEPVSKTHRALSYASIVSDIPIGQIASKSRWQKVVDLRFAIFYVLSDRFGLTLTQIGTAFGGLHHTSVMHGIRVAKARAMEDPAYAALIEGMVEAVRSGDA